MDSLHEVKTSCMFIDACKACFCKGQQHFIKSAALLSSNLRIQYYHHAQNSTAPSFCASTHQSFHRGANVESSFPLWHHKSQWMLLAGSFVKILEFNNGTFATACLVVIEYRLGENCQRNNSELWNDIIYNTVLSVSQYIESLHAGDVLQIVVLAWLRPCSGHLLSSANMPDKSSVWTADQLPFQEKVIPTWPFHL